VIESLRRRAGRFGLDIIFVNVWEGAGAAEEAASYCERWGLEGTVLLDETAGYARQVGVRGVPTNLFVDERGIVRAVGASTFEDLLRDARRLEPRLAGDDAAFANRVPGGFDPRPA
jgi:hypothetical protein